MGKRDEKIALYTQEAKKFNDAVDEALVAKVTIGLGPSIYKKDAETVACSDNEELDRLKKNFLQKKLGLTNEADFDAAIKEVCEKMGSSNRNKYRAVFYYMLAVKFNKQSIYA